MMRRIGIAVGVAIAAAVGLSIPANASTPVLYHQYNFPDACSSAGWAGQQNGTWVSYYCYTVIPVTYNPSSGGPYPGLYDLYVYYS
jgi:hypothetical protein